MTAISVLANILRRHLFPLGLNPPSEEDRGSYRVGLS
jgi:hypothetical protein